MNSQEYWKKREEEQLKHYTDDEAEYDKQIERIYLNMYDGCQKEIDAFYGKYAKKEGITIAEAKKRVSEVDIKAYERKAREYVKAASRDRKNNGGQTDDSGYYFSEKANEEMRLYNLTMKVNRLEMLKSNIGLELVKGHSELEGFMGDILNGRTEKELARQAGILGKTVRNNAKKAKAIVNSSFHNATFSDRIWMHQDLLKDELDKLLQSALIQGKNPRVLARELQRKFDVKVSDAERLMRTELARVQTEAQKQSFEENGFEEYIFIVNGGCCSICEGVAKKNDGVYKVKDMMPGLNAPPMHPNCRCSTAAYEDSDDYEAWLDYLDKGGTTKDWNSFAKAKWQKAQKKSSKDVEKTSKSSKMESGAVSGALTSKNDPSFEKREAFAESYYKEVLGRKREYEIEAVAKNSGFKAGDVDKIFAHVFELEHLFADGKTRKFSPDYDMAQSWIRLRSGKNIQEHDIILLNHELMEANIMGEGTVYEDAHAETEKKYDYAKALKKYLKDNDLE